jgi:ribosomal protein L15
LTIDEITVQKEEKTKIINSNNLKFVKVVPNGAIFAFHKLGKDRRNVGNTAKKQVKA